MGNHLTLQERLRIQEFLDYGYSLGKISEMINRPRCTVSREIRRHTDDNDNGCLTLRSPPYVCNGCRRQIICIREKRIYDARAADEEYKKILRESREGFNISEKTLDTIDSIISDDLVKGESIYEISRKSAGRVNYSESTLYRLVKKRYKLIKITGMPCSIKMKIRRFSSR